MEPQAVDTMALVLRMLQDHLAAQHQLAGQTKWDSAVLIAAITTIGTVLTGVVGLVAKVFAGKIGRLHAETSEQTELLKDIRRHTPPDRPAVTPPRGG